MTYLTEQTFVKCADEMQPPAKGLNNSRRKTVFPGKYCSLGAPTAKCQKCNALMWKEERVNKNVPTQTLKKTVI